MRHYVIFFDYFRKSFHLYCSFNVTTQSSYSFDTWKKDPAGFFNLQEEWFARIIRKHYFCGHLTEKKREEAIRLIKQRMCGSSAINSLKTYSGRATFTVYYIKILKNEITAYSQDEDITLLNTAPRELVLKYKPLVDFIVSKAASTYKAVFEIKHDLEQEVLLSLFDKTDYIKKHYNQKTLFRNYLWSIIYYTLLNHLKSRKWKHITLDGLDYVFDIADKIEDHDFVFCLYDGFRHIDHIMHSYGKQRAKLEICLKVIFSIPVSSSDLCTLFTNHNEIPPTDELGKTCQELNQKTQAAGHNQTQRFAIISPLINKAFDNQSKSDSHLHWTNKQILIIIDKLNSGDTRCFNRETFSILLEMYFMKYYDSKPLNPAPKVVYINKGATSGK